MAQIISIVVAMNFDKIIGVDNNLPWHIPEDLAHFKKITLGKPVIMGRKTFESIGKALPNRANVVITSNVNYTAPNIITTTSLSSALDKFKQEPEVCIIGGGQIFADAINLVNSLHITMVNYYIDTKLNDNSRLVYFPTIDFDGWDKINEVRVRTASGIYCDFIDYKRK